MDDHHPEVYAYLPEPSLELPKTPKQWLANVCATVLHEEFSKWVKDQVEVRHDKVSVKKNIMIQMDPEMEQIFRKSTAVSSKYIQFPPYIYPYLYSEQGSLFQLVTDREQEKKNKAIDQGRERGCNS